MIGGGIFLCNTSFVPDDRGLVVIFWCMSDSRRPKKENRRVGKKIITFEINSWNGSSVIFVSFGQMDV